MLPLPLAAKYKGNEGEPIYCPYPGLCELGAFPRMGQLSMVVGPPGVGKTAFVTDWMLSLPNNPYGRKYNVMFFSADSDRGTVSNRVGAGVTGWELQEVERSFERNDPAIWQRLEEGTRHMGYCFDSNPSYDAIKAELYCFAYAYGSWPHIIVVDNLIDVQGESTGYEGMAETAAWLKNIASETGAAVILLHHTTGTWANGTSPLPLDAVLGKIDKPQRLILTLHKPDEFTLGVSVVKNTNGRAHAPGTDVLCYIDTDLSRMFFSKR